MDKFSNIKPNEIQKKELFSNDYMKVIDYDGWSVVSEKDMVVVLPFLIEYNQIILRQEYIPTYKMIDMRDTHLTVMSGSVEPKEKLNTTVIRELEEEMGIILRDNYPIEFISQLFVSKSNSAKYHLCILPLTESDYQETFPKTDGSKAEMMSKNVKIDVRYINNIISSDTITELMIMKMKKYLNI